MWVLFATLNPISEGTRSLFIKKASKEVDPIVISWVNHLFPVLIYTPLLIFINLKFNPEFWIGVIGSGIINSIASILYMRSISKGDISSVMPMLSFTPLFLLVISPFILGEFPKILGFIGILFVVSGSYFLNLNDSTKGILEPFRALYKNKGTRYMLIVSVLWAISANFDKIGLRSSSVIQFIAFTNILIFSILSFVALTSKKFKYPKSFNGRRNLFLVTFFTSCSYFFHMTALSLTLVAYVVSLKRMSPMISVFLGSKFLNEPNIHERLLGVIVMIIGVLLIVLT